MDDDTYNTIQIAHHVVIPKTDDFIAKRVQVFGSLFIIFFLFQVLGAIQFNDEFLFDANKVGDVVADGMLTAKIESKLVSADS